MSAIILANQSSAPDDAGSGKAQLYATSDGKILQQSDDATLGVQLGKYSTGWTTHLGGVSATAGSSHTITHNLGTTDITVSVWTADDASGTNPKKVEQIAVGIWSGGIYSLGAFVRSVPDANSIGIILGTHGRPQMTSAGLITRLGWGSSAAAYGSGTEYLKVVVIG